MKIISILVLLRHIFVFFFSLSLQKRIAPYLTTIWDHTDGCTNKYCFTLDIYILSCIALKFSIVIDRKIRAPGHGKDMVDGLNDRQKRILRLAMANILNPELI